MSDEEQVQQALRELWDIVKCRCHEAYTGRGLHDPDCECDSTDAVQTVTNVLAALTELLATTNEQLAAARCDAEEAEAYAAELEANGLANRVAIMRLEAKLAKVKEAFRRNMMHALPAYTHKQFDKDYEELVGGKDE